MRRSPDQAGLCEDYLRSWAMALRAATDPDLGFQVGDHVCAFYSSSSNSLDDIVVDYISAGLQAGHKCFAMVDTPSAVRDRIPGDLMSRDGMLHVLTEDEAYMPEGEAAEDGYRAAIHRLGQTRVRLDLARAHLLYGEWLRRENRRIDAREQLRRAHEMLQAMGAEGFAERARRELMAAGQAVRKRTAETAGELTAQERQIALRARTGRTNAEIGAELFLSPRTVEWHMSNVFMKLGITSRGQLWHTLDGDAAIAVP